MRRKRSEIKQAKRKEKRKQIKRIQRQRRGTKKIIEKTCEEIYRNLKPGCTTKIMPVILTKEIQPFEGKGRNLKNKLRVIKLKINKRIELEPHERELWSQIKEFSQAIGVSNPKTITNIGFVITRGEKGQKIVPAIEIGGEKGIELYIHNRADLKDSFLNALDKLIDYLRRE